LSATRPVVSVIILNYNGLPYVQACLGSVLRSDYTSFEVVFVDNNSTDESLEYAQKNFGNDSRLKIIKNYENYGYAKGNNLGVNYADGEYLVFLNVDTAVEHDWLIELIEFLNSHTDVGIVQCKLKSMDDRTVLDCTGHFIDWFGIAFVLGHGERDEGQYESITRIFAASGAAFGIRRNVFEKLGGFDEDFFMLFEEDDLCWRGWIAGYAVFYVPNSVVYHKSAAIRSTVGTYKTLYLSRRNRMVSMLKNYSVANLLRFMPMNIILVFAIAFFTRDKVEYLKAFRDSFISVCKDMRAVIRKRRAVAQSRVLTDRYLIDQGIIRKPVLRDMLRKGY
jgi:hypothetical protein